MTHLRALTATAPHRGPAHAATTPASVLLTSLRLRRAQVWRLAAWSAVEALPALVSGMLVAAAIDDGFLSGRLWTGFGWLALLGLSVVIGTWGTRQTMARLAEVVEPFRDELVTRVVVGALRRSTLRGGRRGGADVARLTQQVEIVREAYAAVLIVVLQFGFAAVGAVIGLVALAPMFLALVVPPLVLALGALALVLKRMAAHQRAAILADEMMSEAATTVGGALRDVAACGGQDLAQAAVRGHIEAAREASTAVSRLTGLATLTVVVGGWLPLLLILAFAPTLIAEGATVGVLLGAATYVLQALAPALQTLVDGLTGPGLWLMVTLRRIVDATGNGTETASSAARAKAPTNEAGYDLRLSGVTFGYSGRARPVIEDFDLTVPENDHLAIVGPSGVGKSTLAGLMTGLYEPRTGQVSIGGIGLLGQRPAELATTRTLIPQEAYVFTGPVRENLAYLHEAVSDEELDRAVELLGARMLVRELGGYDAELDPSALSAGERQLITLVRAYVSPARIVILDEATCHLDPAAEARVELAFAERPGSLVIVAHRMSSALRARRVLVMDGAVTMLGEHDELLVRSALYRDLVGHWDFRGSSAGAR